MIKFGIQLISLTLIASSFVHAATKNEIDDLMYEASGLIIARDFNAARAAYSAILEFDDDMTLSQRANLYYSLLQLSYVLDSQDDAKKYGTNLIHLIKNEPDYAKPYERLKCRICISQDWAKFQKAFSEYCD